MIHQKIYSNTHRGAGTRKSSSSRPRGEKKGPEGKLEWQAIAKKLVPEGRASYALWFTTCNIALIIGVFAYMAGDYAQWVRENPTELDNAEFTTVRFPPFCMLSSRQCRLFQLETCNRAEYPTKTLG